MYSLKSFIVETFSLYNLNYQKYLEIDNNLKRHLEIIYSFSDPSNAEKNHKLESSWVLTNLKIGYVKSALNLKYEVFFRRYYK